MQPIDWTVIAAGAAAVAWGQPHQLPEAHDAENRARDPQSDDS